MANKLEVVLSVVEEGFSSFKKAMDDFDGLARKTIMLNQAFEAVKNVSGAVKGAFDKLYGSASNIAEAVDKQSQSLNMSTSEMQRWNYVANQNKASTGSVTNAFTKLLNTQYEATTGNKAASDAFKDLGVSVTNANGTLKSSDQIINDTMNALSGVEHESRRAALAQDIFGKGGKDLLTVLSQGTDALNAQKNAADELGQVMSESAIKNFAAMNDALDRMKTTLSIAGGELISSFLPAMQRAVDLAVKLTSESAKGWAWMLGGEEAAKKASEAANARTAELQDMIKLKAEYENIIGTQEAFQRHKSDLFDPDTLTYYKDALSDLKANIKDFTKTESSGGTGFTPGSGGTGTDKKADNKLMSLERQAAQMHRKASEDDAKATWEHKQTLLKADKLASEKREKERVALSKKSYVDIINAQNASYDIMKNNEREQYQYNKELKAQEKQMYIANGREQLNVLTDVLQQAAAKNKAAAVAYKTIAIATTVIDTYSGAQKAFNSLASIPYVGYALGLIAAGATVAAGMMRVNEIRKQQFASGGTSAGGMALVGEMGPEYVNLPRGSQVINHHQTSQMINNANRSSTVLNVTIQGGHGTVSQQLTTELRGGKSDLLMKRIAKALGV